MNLKYGRAGWPALLSLLLLVNACGSDGADCSEIAGEQHLGQVELPDGSGAVMLHQVGRECPVVGENTFQLWLAAGTSVAPEIVQQHGTEDDAAMSDAMSSAAAVTVVTVDAVMPSMGHGTAVPAVIDPDHAGRFVVTFQMPGDWRIEADVVPASGVTQSVTFDVLVH